MSITISKFDDQSRGYFDDSRVKERKGVYFESEIKGASSLFYWACSWSEEGGTVEEHAHKGFEIITYVLDGEIEQQESGSEEWVKLKKGDLQVMRSGNGLSHTEKFNAGAKTLQVWLDPDFRRSLQRPSSGTDYEAADFEAEDFEGMRRIDFCGDESPAWFATPIQMDRYDCGPGSFKLNFPKDHIFTAMVIGGELTANGEVMEEGDMVRVESDNKFEFEVAESAALFTVIVPAEPGYRTYTDQMQMSS